MIGSWIQDSGQSWKVFVLFFFLLFATLAVFPSHSILLSTGLPVPVIDTIGIVTAGLTLAWAAVAIKCPQCSLRVGLWYMKNRPVLAWFTDFLALRECPVCGHSPSNQRSSRQPIIGERK